MWHNSVNHICWWRLFRLYHVYTLMCLPLRKAPNIKSVLLIDLWRTWEIIISLENISHTDGVCHICVCLDLFLTQLPATSCVSQLLLLQLLVVLLTIVLLTSINSSPVTALVPFTSQYLCLMSLLTVWEPLGYSLTPPHDTEHNHKKRPVWQHFLS